MASSSYLGATIGAATTAPGGASGDVQYNNSGSLGGFGDWDGSLLTVPGNATIGLGSVTPTSGVISLLDTIDINAGSVLSGSADASYIQLSSGANTDAMGTGNAGDISLLAGYAAGSGDGGTIELRPGTSGTGSAGVVLLQDAVGNAIVTVESGGARLLNGAALRGDTTDAHTYKFSVYDVNGTAYRDWMTATNGNAPDVTFTPPATGTLVMQATTYKSSDGSTGATAGPFTTITGITVKNGLVTALTGS